MTQMDKQRARKSHSIEEKMEVIKRIDRGERIKDICLSMNMSSSTVCTMNKMRDKIQKAYDSMNKGNDLDRDMKTRSKIYDKLEKYLIHWINEQSQSEIPLTHSLIKEKALSRFNELKNKLLQRGDESVRDLEFKATQEWFDRFKTHAMQGSVRDEIDVLNTDETTSFKEFPSTMDLRNQIVTFDENARATGSNDKNTEMTLESYQIKCEELTNDEIYQSSAHYSPQIERLEEDHRHPNIDSKGLEILLKQAETLTSFAMEHDGDMNRSIKFKNIVLDAVAPYKELYEMLQIEKMRKMSKMLVDQAESLVAVAIDYDSDIDRSAKFKDAILDAVAPYKSMYEKLQAKTKETTMLNYFASVSPISSVDLSQCVTVDGTSAKKGNVCNVYSVHESLPAAISCPSFQQEALSFTRASDKISCGLKTVRPLNAFVNADK